VNSKPPTLANHIVNAVLSHVRNNKDPLIATPFKASEIERRSDLAKLKFSGDDSTPYFEPDTGESILHVGLDWGASKTCLKASFANRDELVLDECIPTVLGYAKDGIVEGVLPDDATTLFGRDALTYRRHLHLAYPTLNSASSADFARNLRSRLAGISASEVRTVIAAPATLDPVARENIRHSIARHFHSVIILPQPFLAALGYRDESRLLDSDYADPVRNSILIDIGAANTSLCLVQGYYPTADEQMTITFGGNDVDESLRSAILDNHPYAELSPISIRHLKETHAFAGVAKDPVLAEVVIAGKTRALDLTAELASATNELLSRVFESLKALIAVAPSDSVPDLLQNIILTGGGSRIKNIASDLQTRLASEGYANPRVQTVGDAYKHLAAAGALKAARQARDHHWQQVAK
jgi:rod shape-determining protein MreB